MRRGNGIEKATRNEILRKQIELLAEDSYRKSGNDLVQSSLAMAKLSKQLRQPFIVIVLTVLLHFFICSLIKLNKFNRR